MYLYLYMRNNVRFNKLNAKNIIFRRNSQTHSSESNREEKKLTNEKWSCGINPDIVSNAVFSDESDAIKQKVDMVISLEIIEALNVKVAPI